MTILPLKEIVDLPLYPDGPNALYGPAYRTGQGEGRQPRLWDFNCALAGQEYDHTVPTPTDLDHNRFSEIPPVLSQLRPLQSLDLRGNPLTTCPLPLPWQIDRFIFPPDYELFGNFDHWLLSPRSGTEPSDLPFLALCLE